MAGVSPGGQAWCCLLAPSGVAAGAYEAPNLGAWHRGGKLEALVTGPSTLQPVVVKLPAPVPSTGAGADMSGKRLRLLYLFSGPAVRPGGFREFAVAAGDSAGALVGVEYIDLVNDESHDVAEQSFFDNVCADVDSELCQGVLASPP